MAAISGTLVRLPAGSVPPILAFAVAGSIGFVVDATVCKLLISAGVPALLARVPAILLAMSVTFALNRTVTFRARGPLLPQVLRYFAVNAAGATFNYAVFAVALFSTHGLMPMAALVAGCGAGAAVNYLGAKTVAFPASERR